MEENIKTIKILGHEIEYLEINNKKKNTLLMLHGMNSSYKFAKDLYPLVKDFNVISINFPLNEATAFSSKEISMDILVEITNEIINQIKTKVYILGHSLAGGIISTIKNVKKVFYLCTINPSMFSSEEFNKYKKILLPNSKGDKIKNVLYKGVISNVLAINDKKASYFMKLMLSNNSGYKNIVTNNLLNEEYIFIKLKDDYLKNKNKSIYITGEKDLIVNSKRFISFIESIDKRTIVVDNAGHNPIVDNPELIYSILKENIPNKKYWFKKNIHLF